MKEEHGCKMSNVFLTLEQGHKTTRIYKETTILCPNSQPGQVKDQSSNNGNCESDVNNECSSKSQKRFEWKKNNTGRNQIFAGIEYQIETKNDLSQKESSKNYTGRNQVFTRTEHRSKPNNDLSQKGKTKKKMSNLLPVILITLTAFGISHAQDLPKVAIMTNPIVFGEDVTFQCSCKSHTALSSLSAKWLKGDGKDSISYKNVSANGKKYTSVINLKDDVYLYLLTVHNVSEADLGPYFCAFDFKDAILMFTMDINLSFIYLPVNSDIVLNISKSTLKIWIPRIFPPPNCTCVYNDADISELMTQECSLETTMYSTQLRFNMTVCSGNINISCIVGSRSFYWSKNFPKSHKEIECSTGKYTISMTLIVFVIISILAGISITGICIFKCTKKYKDKRPKTPKTDSEEMVW